MADIIQLLPDAIANQIAAGEVIQRPASVVKELMENAIDAGATYIRLIIKDAGKTLIQVIDDGCGMSETDARMSFERHATSKVREANDLFSIRTMGFRGEALASIAAIAHVELKTRKQADELGTRIVLEGSIVKTQEPCQCAAGTSFSVKNLFYNVPARRNFLKSDTVEMRHIIEEFQRIVLANADIHFSLHHNGAEVFHLTNSNIRQRIVALFGPATNKKLVPVSEETDILKLEGYVGKPEFAKKTRGEQYFFVNNRFIKSPYLHHAIMGSYEELLAKDAYPLYVIFIDIDPKRIDINVHPTKQEIKFEDERLIYNYLKVSVRHALGQHSITPSLDFEQDVNFARSRVPKKTQDQTTIKSSAGNFDSNAGNSTSPNQLQSNNLRNWQKLYQGLEEFDTDSSDENSDESHSVTIESKWLGEDKDGNEQVFKQEKKEPYQVQASYIINQIKSGFILIDQQSAHERILYERYLAAMNENEPLTQKQLFPKNFSLGASDSEMLKSILPQINQLGFDIQEFGQEGFVVHGTPAQLGSGQNEEKLIESLLEQYKQNQDLKLDIRENIARSMARSTSIKRGQRLSIEEMRNLVDQLFACEIPYKNPFGRHCFITYEMDELEKRFSS